MEAAGEQRAWYEPLLDRGVLPDRVLRLAVRRRLAVLLQRLEHGQTQAGTSGSGALRDAPADAPLATASQRANEQHYELPPAFFAAFLGPRRKYSCCLFPAGDGADDVAAERGGVDILSQAEDGMLHLSSERADIQDGMAVLDLGCGWGSFSLWLAEHLPACRVTAVSNSRSQGEYIRQRARELGLGGIEVLTSDVSYFQPDRRYQRIVSIEMLEHLRNHRAALARMADWLTPDGRAFVHVFSHRRFAYLFDESRREDWMARHFFAGGTMPSHGFLPSLNADLECVADWWLPGTHYRRTLEAWLRRYDAEYARVLPILQEVYGGKSRAGGGAGHDHAHTAPGAPSVDPAVLAWWHRWRLFFIACAETFGYRQGQEWGVSHYVFRRAR